MFLWLKPLFFFFFQMWLIFSYVFSPTFPWLIHCSVFFGFVFLRKLICMDNKFIVSFSDLPNWIGGGKCNNKTKSNLQHLCNHHWMQQIWYNFIIQPWSLKYSVEVWQWQRCIEHQRKRKKKLSLTWSGHLEVGIISASFLLYSPLICNGWLHHQLMTWCTIMTWHSEQEMRVSRPSVLGL